MKNNIDEGIILEAYGDYRVSEGRTRVGMENLKLSLIYPAFKAGYEAGRASVHKSIQRAMDFEEDDLEDAL